MAREIGEAVLPADGPSSPLLRSCGEFAVGFSDAAARRRRLGPSGDLGGRLVMLVSVRVMAACSLGSALLPPASPWGHSSAMPLISTWLQDSQGLRRTPRYPA